MAGTTQEAQIRLLEKRKAITSPTLLTSKDDSMDEVKQIIEGIKVKQMPKKTETKMEEIGAILPGSRVFIKKNLAAYSQYLAEHD